MKSAPSWLVLLQLVVLFGAVSMVQTSPDEIDRCGLSGIYKTRQSALTSPHYPEPYPPGSCWDYVVRSPYRCPTKFHVQFLDFFVEPSPNCARDSLAIGLIDGDMDRLCGAVVGIRKYRTADGVLRLRFRSDGADQARPTYKKGFKLLVTRLACERNDVEETESGKVDDQSNSLLLELQPPHHNRLVMFRNLSSRAESQNADKQALSAPLQSGFFQQGAAEDGQRAAFVPEACCATSFRQQRFYLSSPGFPSTTITPLLPLLRRDCQFHLEKAAPSICRLRIVFKFFNFGYAASVDNSLGVSSSVNKDTTRDICYGDYIEIDGSRVCGCRTGYIFTALWGLGRKVLRLRMGHSGLASSGFLLDIVQEECIDTQLELLRPQYSFEGPPVYHQQSQPQLPASPQPQSVFPPFFYTHRQSFGNSAGSTLVGLVPNDCGLPHLARSKRFPATNSSRYEYSNHQFDGNQVNEEGSTSRQAQATDGNYIIWKQNRCHFEMNDVYRLSVDPLWLTKPICQAPQSIW